MARWGGRARPAMQVPSPSVREAASMYGTAVAVFLVILVAALQGSAPAESPFPFHIPLDPEGTLELSWNISYAQETIYFQLLVRELKAGVLFGMSDRGELENADLVVLWTDRDGAYFGDAWSDQKGQVHLDSQQDYQLLRAQRTPEGLYLLFKRPFGTCDPNDYLIEDGTVHLVYGFLEEPLRSLESINTSGLHTGLQRVQLLKPSIPKPALPADTRTMEIRAPDVLIPGQQTTYWCYVTELPDGFPRHHIVMYEPIVTEGNEALVHHMEVFQCAAEFETIPHFSGPCDSKMKPQRLNFCRHVLAAWALGAKAFYYPEEAGLAFGGPGSSRFLRLEVHYHNPLVITGRRDSSGIRLYYTAALRRFDAGIMELGLAYTPVMAIPPQETAFVLTGYCTDKCTQLLLQPPQPPDPKEPSCGCVFCITLSSNNCGPPFGGAAGGKEPAGHCRKRPARLRDSHLRLSAPHAPDRPEGGHSAGQGRPGDRDREQGQPLQPTLPGDPHVEEGRVCPAGRRAHHLLHIQHGRQEAGHRGGLRDPGGDVRQLCALLPPDAAGALQERRGPWLPAQVLPPREQVQQRGSLHLPPGVCP
uniref:Dopamine beta-hydroxylase n=1 Tax=Bos indicus x Bos taurus TaxID=30522 RepID=A0A4W2BTN9_BOBOX